MCRYRWLDSFRVAVGIHSVIIFTAFRSYHSTFQIYWSIAGLVGTITVQVLRSLHDWFRDPDVCVFLGARQTVSNLLRGQYSLGADRLSGLVSWGSTSPAMLGSVELALL